MTSSRLSIQILSLSLLLVLAACNGDDADDVPPEVPADTPVTEVGETPTVEVTPPPDDDAVEDSTPAPDETPVAVDDDDEEEQPAEPVEDLEVSTFVQDVNMPSSITFTNDGRMFFNEVYDGRVRVVENGQLLEEPFATLNIATSEGWTEHGLLGLALHPDFDENGYVYVFYTEGSNGGSPTVQRIVRFTDQDNVGVDMEIIVDRLPFGPRCCHNGGRIDFGPDGMLYATLGDVEEPGTSQNPDSLPGSILRYTPDGAIPDDNPFGDNNPVYAYGLRNPFGITFHPETGDLFVTENGPQGYDEVNRILPGENYGWPEVQGIAGDERFIDPIWATTDTAVAPTGVEIPTGSGIPQLEGQVLFCNWNTGELIALQLNEDNFDEVVGEQILPVECHLDVEEGPDGAIYASARDSIFRYGPPVE